MSALMAPSERPEGRRDSSRLRARHLRALPNRTARLGRLPLLILMGIVVGLGMVGVLVLSVVNQQQSGRLDDLTTQNELLGEQQAALQSQLDTASSTTSLVSAAYAMGMRPNPTPAFVQLSTGRVIGTPTRVTGHELSAQVPQSVLQQASAIAAARAALTASANTSAGSSTKPGASPTTASPSTASPTAASPSTRPSARASASTSPAAASSSPSTRASQKASNKPTTGGHR